MTHSIHLVKYGYGIDKPPFERHTALKQAVKENGTKNVLNYVTSIRNYQFQTSNKKILNDDLTFLKKMHSEQKGGSDETKTKIHEVHTLNGNEIIFKNLDDEDELNKYDSEFKIVNAEKTIIIKSNDIIKGYCYLEIDDKFNAEILTFKTEKGFGTPLFIFIQKFMELNNCDKMVYKFKLGDDSVKMLNFWYKMGLEILSLDFPNVVMEKEL
jgi:hypothetical protein